MHFIFCSGSFLVLPFATALATLTAWRPLALNNLFFLPARIKKWSMSVSKFSRRHYNAGRTHSPFFLLFFLHYEISIQPDNEPEANESTPGSLRINRIQLYVQLLQRGQAIQYFDRFLQSRYFVVIQVENMHFLQTRQGIYQIYLVICGVEFFQLGQLS